MNSHAHRPAWSLSDDELQQDIDELKAILDEDCRDWLVATEPLPSGSAAEFVAWRRRVASVSPLDAIDAHFKHVWWQFQELAAERARRA